MIETFNDDFMNVDWNQGLVEAIITDPPYGSTRVDYDRGIDPNDLMGLANRILRPGGVMAVTCDLGLAARMIGNVPKGWTWHDLVWHKTTPTGFLNAKRQPLRAHEYILVFRKKGEPRTYNPQMTHGHTRKVSSKASKDKCEATKVYGKAENVDYDSTDRYPTSVLTFASDKQREHYHPAQKPLELMRWLVRTYTNEGDLIADPYAGSGTTGIAAMLENRSCVLVEKDKDYYDKMIERIDKWKRI